MAFSDWVFEQTSNATANLTASSPLSGSSSLELSLNANATNRGQAGYVIDSGVPLGMSKGKIRTLIQKVSGNDVEEFASGIFCLAEATDFGSNGSTEAYVAIMDTEFQGVQLRYTSITNSTSGLLTKVDSLGFTNGVTKALELEWDNNPTEIGGIHFIVRVGSMTDFSDLTEVINFVDPTSRTIAGYEGICHINDSSLVSPVWYFDDTSIFELV